MNTNPIIFFNLKAIPAIPRKGRIIIETFSKNLEKKIIGFWQTKQKEQEKYRKIITAATKTGVEIVWNESKGGSKFPIRNNF